MEDQQLDFMLHPERWPETSAWSKRIYLKHGPQGQDLAMLAYLKGRWGFCRESAPFEADLSTVKWGGKELVQQLILDGWEVD